MDLDSLPKVMFAVGHPTEGAGVSVQGCKDTANRKGIFIWTSRALAQEYADTLSGPYTVMEIDRDMHLLLWINETGLEYCIVDRDPIDANFDPDIISADCLPTDRLLLLAGTPAQLALALRLLRSQGADEAVISVAERLGTESPELRPSQLFARMSELADEQMKQVQEAEQAYASLPPNVRNAMRNLVPRDGCVKCGETNWYLEDVSSSGKAAKWKCNFCGKKTVVREGEVNKPAPTFQRQIIEKDIQREVWQRDMGRCVECGSRENIEFDHIIPVSKGGSSTVRNIQLLCEPCNRQKSNLIG